jgi:hypothetical protein
MDVLPDLFELTEATTASQTLPIDLNPLSNEISHSMHLPDQEIPYQENESLRRQEESPPSHQILDNSPERESDQASRTRKTHFFEVGNAAMGFFGLVMGGIYGYIQITEAKTSNAIGRAQLKLALLVYCADPPREQKEASFRVTLTCLQFLLGHGITSIARDVESDV